MPLTPETLTRHELCGLPARVVAAASDAYVGIAGRVVSESERTLVIRESPSPSNGDASADERSGDKRVPKAGATFEFALPSTCGRESPRASDEARGDGFPRATDEAAGVCKPPGSASELPPPGADALAVGRGHHDTAGVEPGQSGGCEDVVYVTVDGARLLSRPAYRTERAGDSTWQ